MGTYTEISTTDTAANIPVTEDLVGDIAANAKYNYDHAARCGTDAVGVRLGVARGKIPFDIDGSVGDDKFTGTIVFATTTPANGGPIDGDPNFLASSDVITVVITPEDPNTGDDWNGAGYNNPPISVWVKYAVAAGFTYHIEFNCAGSLDLDGILHWIAFGDVAAGE